MRFEAAVGEAEDQGSVACVLQEFFVEPFVLHKFQELRLARGGIEGRDFLLYPGKGREWGNVFLKKVLQHPVGQGLRVPF